MSNELRHFLFVENRGLVSGILGFYGFAAVVLGGAAILNAGDASGATLDVSKDEVTEVKSGVGTDDWICENFGHRCDDDAE